MSDNVTKKDLSDLEDKLSSKIDSAVDDLTGLIQTFMVQVDARFNKVEKDIAELNQKYDHLVQTLDTFIARINHYETEQAMRNRQFERLLAWA